MKIKKDLYTLDFLDQVIGSGVQVLKIEVRGCAQQRLSKRIAKFQMSKNGKSILLHSKEAKVFFTLKCPNHIIIEIFELEAKASPVKIIMIKET